MHAGLLVGYFGTQDEARKACRLLRAKGYRRSVWLSKDAGGTIRTQWSKFRLPRRVVEDKVRWLLPGESALLVQTAIDSMETPALLVLEGGEVQPALFILYPEREPPNGGSESSAGVLTPPQLQDYAQQLGAKHRPSPLHRPSADLLARIKQGSAWVHDVCVDLTIAHRLEQSVSPAAEWLLDNEYVVESNSRNVLHNLPRRFFRQLPPLADGTEHDLPRIYTLAHELVSHTDMRIDQENILSFLTAYQSEGPLSIGELWAFPQLLRTALLERIQQIAGRIHAELRERGMANLWANRLIAVTRRDPQQVFSLLATITGDHPNPSPYFASQLIDYLYDEQAVLEPVQNWLERKFQMSVSELSMRAKNRQVTDQISIGNAFTSLRFLEVIDWKACFELLSQVETVLRQDPAGLYGHMDFNTRDLCRQSVETLRRGSDLSETLIAQRALDFATTAAHDSPGDARSTHVGTYLIGDRRKDLARAVGCRDTARDRILHWVYRHHTPAYLGGINLIALALMGLILGAGLPDALPGIQIALAILLLIPVSQISLDVLNYLVIRLMPPRTLSKMDYRVSGIPDAYRTLVVVPVLLVDRATIHDEVEKLEIRYLANREKNLLFSLFSDFVDSDQAHTSADAALLSEARQGIEALNQQHGGSRFLLFHRERQWSESEQRFIGWERKRGKLEELNGLIAGTRSPDAEPLVHAGIAEQLGDIRYIITLDSDTQLPNGTARRLVETLSHPLNQAEVSPDGRIVAGYTIIQPRVSPTLPSTTGSPFSRLFSDPVGIDPYTNAVSDVNQDISGEGSYHGKGIYDVRAFNNVLGGRFPDAWLLSHDLIEGAHVRVGLASDIELYDEFPQDYITFIKRQHRWIRGDWQIAAWVLPRVPNARGGTSPNPLRMFDRGKIFDNLRRSLLPPASLALLMASWAVSFQAGAIATAVVAVQLLFHPLAQPVTWATSGMGSRRISIARLGHDLMRVLVEAALLPYQAWLVVDAVVRILYRRHVSHRRLLQWTTAKVMQGRARAKLPKFLLSMGLASVFSLLVGWLLLAEEEPTLAVAGPWLGLWFLSPVIGWLLNRRPDARKPVEQLRREDRLFLRGVARRTWRYFSEFVNAETSWLPPDNYQVSYQNTLALRTSPTNIGLWLVSAVGAHEFGYASVDSAIRMLSGTMETLDTLERHEGHLLNWYDIPSLAPLKPRYVSTVDSGNLLGALWTLDGGLVAMMRAPLVGRRVVAGLQDVAAILSGAIGDRNVPFADVNALKDIQLLPDAVRLIDALLLVRKAHCVTGNLAAPLTAIGGSAAAWRGELQRQVDDWLNMIDRYLTWVEILNEKTEAEIGSMNPAAVPSFRSALSRAPSLRDLAGGTLAWVPYFEEMRKASGTPESSHAGWFDRLFTALGESRWLAGEMLAMGGRLRDSARRLSEGMNMRFLYDANRRVFSIGYNLTEGRLDRAYYDLLASEARLGGFVAIARGEIPVEHWFAMNRPYGAAGRRRVLLSWTGTMFEYLMPLLFQRSYANSLLDQAAKEAVAIQIGYGRRKRVPWGVSESASGDLDNNKTYQYHAFGVPELGLKRGLADKTVVAPYATLLAMSIAPGEGMRNLHRLAALGLLDEFGYFDAMDFSQQAVPGGERGAVVKTYMAHHQGMGFLSLANLLHENVIQKYFHADPRVRAVEPLLHERLPYLPLVNQIAPRARVSSIAAVGEVAPSVSQFETPHTSLPRTQLLSNGRYSVMVTNAGGGYSRWGEHEITRWRSDRTRDSRGTFCFIHERSTGRLWCNTYQPVGGEVDGFSADFSLDRAVFRRTDNGIDCETEVIVVPEDDVEIRRMTLINRTLRACVLDVTTYAELSLAPHAADRQHPAFNKLFIQTEAVPGEHALLAFRRPRRENETPVWVGHRLTLQSDDSGQFRYETDRARFIGRGRTIARPMGAFQETGNTEGCPIDPILSLRKSVRIGSGERVEISMIMACGSSREGVLGMMSKYANPYAVERAMDLAWASAHMELRLLHVQPDDARRFQQLASHVLFPNPMFRSPEERLVENRKGQSGLWPYGISGDLPIVLVATDELQELGVMRQMLQVHTYWRLHGLITDLVILNEESSSYERPLHEQLERLIQSYAVTPGIDRPGGVFLRSADTIPAEDLTLLRSAASVVIVAARGTLTQQFGLSPETPEPTGVAVWKRDFRDPSAVLPFMELPYFNSLGGFTPDGREYAIYLGRGMNTPAPWVNVIANAGFGTIVSETGAGYTWRGNSQRNRLTGWSNDPVLDPPSDAIYIRDEETGAYWTPCAAPIREETAYRARHGAGYSVFEHNSHGIEQELTVFVPVDDPVKLQTLLLRNDTNRVRKLSVTYFAEWTLGESRETSLMHVATAWDEDAQAVVARNPYHPNGPDSVAFAAVSLPADSYTGDRTRFLGRNRSMENPVVMQRKGLSRRTGAGLDPCAGIQTILRLLPGERIEVTCMLGQAPTLAEARALVVHYREGRSVSSALSRTKAWWDERLDVVQVHTPELAADLLVNRWLLYQTLSCRMMARSAVYQSGGAFGFRDQLQDVLALLHADPAVARAHILLAASRQFVEGDVQHWWHPPEGSGIRSRISDDLLWLPYVVAAYVKTTGDESILTEMAGFLAAPVLASDEHESYQTPAISQDRATLFEHCQRAVTRGMTSGPHGLPLIGTGDWNDGMNEVGPGGKGESVWLAWFVVDVLKGMAELADRMGRTDLKQTYLRSRKTLIDSVERFAWDGAWYLRATFDDGTLLGSAANREARIDSIAQSWAMLADAGDRDRARTAIESAWSHLVREKEGLVLLFEPPFDTANPSPGYIRGYPPGVRENGGQYTHAAVWLAMAMARSGDGTRAATIMRMLNPIEHARTPETVWQYGVEPYVMAADVYRLPGRIGRGGWTWYTGSAAWMYRAWVEEILGLRVQGETMRIAPVIPGRWSGFTMTYRHGETLYEIQVDNPDHFEHGVAWVEMDGQRVKDGIVMLERGLVKHRVVVRMGNTTN